MNSNFVLLIPKVAISVRIIDFCPIVMGNITYKIYTKILATRLGSFIGEILSPLQFGFILGRRVHTCIALASDTINSLDTVRKGHMAIKADITKAFDTISWNFLLTAIRCMNFSDRFVGMIMGILHSARLSSLLNGSPHGYFSCSKGICQGDSLSPLLFCLAKEALARWIDFDIDANRVYVHVQFPRYLLYADDIIILLEATFRNCRNIHHC